jgi:hypothetical protein
MQQNITLGNAEGKAGFPTILPVKAKFALDEDEQVRKTFLEDFAMGKSGQD